MKSKRLTTAQLGELIAIDRDYARDDRGGIRSEVQDLILRLTWKPETKSEQIDYFTPLADADVPEQYQATLAKYRRLAINHNVPPTIAICYRVKAGFTLKTHAPMAGPCFENYQYLQDWIIPDEPTEDSLVFWVPRIIKGSTSKAKCGQAKLIKDLRAKLELPVHHMNGFGKAGLVTGLILAHFMATGERIPLNQCWVRTDTCSAGGIRLSLGDFDSTGGLFCDDWVHAVDADDEVGVFALGVEPLG